MTSLKQFTDDMLASGKSHFVCDEALVQLELSSKAFTAASNRLKKKNQLASPFRGFYLILRPEDRFAGAPDPICWIDPLMQYLNLDYRITLLTAAALHGSSHQAAMLFQVAVPKQLRNIEIGRHNIQFVYQNPANFKTTNQPNWLFPSKSLSGFAKAAGVELTLLDCARYYRKVGGINSLAQITKAIGYKARPNKLARIANSYENSTVRRLGYLLDYVGHERQAKSLIPFVKRAKSLKPLNPSVQPINAVFSANYEENRTWMLLINEVIEIDF